MAALSFSVVGVPVPQGSTRAFSRGGRVHTTNDPTGIIERWRGDIRTAAGPAIGRWTGPGLPVAAPVRVTLGFRFPRPSSHYLPANSRRSEPVLRPAISRWTTSRNDIDKLCRAVLDALTGVVYVDDSQVVGLAAAKRYADPGERNGVNISIEVLR